MAEQLEKIQLIEAQRQKELKEEQAARIQKEKE